MVELGRTAAELLVLIDQVAPWSAVSPWWRSLADLPSGRGRCDGAMPELRHPDGLRDTLNSRSFVAT